MSGGVVSDRLWNPMSSFLVPIRRFASVPVVAGAFLLACIPCKAAAVETAIPPAISTTTKARPVQTTRRMCVKRSKLGHCEHWRKRVVAGKPKADATAHR